MFYLSLSVNVIVIVNVNACRAIVPPSEERRRVNDFPVSLHCSQNYFAARDFPPLLILRGARDFDFDSDPDSDSDYPASFRFSRNYAAARDYDYEKCCLGGEGE